jgi:membrane protease YdiL (CAAX protease family)
MKPPVLEYLSPFTKLVFVVLLVISCGIIFIMGGIFLVIPLFKVNLLNDPTLLTDYQNPDAVTILKFLQVIQSVGLFIIPAFLAGYFFNRDAPGYLGLKKGSNIWTYIIVITIMCIIIPAISFLGTVNEMMQLPASLHRIEDWMKDTEDQAGKLTDAFLDIYTVPGFFVNLVMIAIIPAFGEELVFRGLLQRLFAEWFRNVHVAIVFCAFIFAAIHLQFYGFLPRFTLGLLFGYLFYWTGSLWIPILCHFLNNGAAVVASFLNDRGIISSGYEEFGSTNNVYIICGSFFVTVLLLFLFYKTSHPAVKTEIIPAAEPRKEEEITQGDLPYES